MRRILWLAFDSVTAGAMGGVVGLRLIQNGWDILDATFIGYCVAVAIIVLIFAATIYAREFSK